MWPFNFLVTCQTFAVKPMFVCAWLISVWNLSLSQQTWMRWKRVSQHDQDGSQNSTWPPRHNPFLQHHHSSFSLNQTGDMQQATQSGSFVPMLAVSFQSNFMLFCNFVCCICMCVSLVIDGSTMFIFRSSSDQLMNGYLSPFGIKRVLN